MSDTRPSGTVTFLFTDIEGSTQRWDRRREAMQEAVRRHDALMRAAIDGHAGHVFKTIGDAFCAVFERAEDGIAAALEAQRALGSEDFSAVDGIAVRMALHTGTTDERDGDYFGPAVNRVARLLSIGHGGQVLLSDVTAQLIGGHLDGGVTLRDLGRHHLKDLSEPESVRQLCAPDLRADFPALRSVGANPTNVPQQPTSFVGRDEERREIEGLLRENRLVTLLGPGGIGKTRLSQQVGTELLDEFADGVWFVNLTPLQDPSLVPNEIAAALGVAEAPNRPVLETLVHYLAGKELLLIVDNCEHVIDEAAKSVNAIVRGCAKVRLLATSREALRSDGESVVRISVFPEAQAVALFADRAKAVDSRFELTNENKALVTEICRRLDGLPLAIELAAARVRTIPLKTLREKLDERLRVLTGASRGSLQHHQTMRALIDWSYDLLSEDERKLFRRLGVFSGGFALEQLLETCFGGDTDELDAIDLAAALVDKSLVQMQTELEDRYSLLESIREYAREKLKENDEFSPVAHAHVAAYTALAEHLENERDDTADREWADRAYHELDNWRAALGWALSSNNDVLAGQQLAGALESIWARVAPVEGARWLAAAVATVNESTPAIVAGRLHLARAHIAMLGLLFEDAIGSATQAVELLAGEAPVELARAQMCAGAASSRLGRVEEGEELLTRSLEAFRTWGSRRNAASALQYLGLLHIANGDLEAARKLLAEARENLLSVKSGERVAAHMALVIGEIEFQSGNAEAALELASDALLTDRALRDENAMIFDLCNIAAYLLALERYDDARANAEEALERSLEADSEVGFLIAMQHLAAGAALRRYDGEAEARSSGKVAAMVLGYVDARRERLGARRDFTEKHGYEAALAAMDRWLGPEETRGHLASGAGWTKDRALEAARALATASCFAS